MRGHDGVGRTARSFWVREPGAGEIRTVPLRDPGAGEVLVRTLVTGVSRGTESLVFSGRVPATEHTRMRAPHQSGSFPGPVKYGYLNVGVVEEGPRDLVGRTVFCLYPHQDAYVVPAADVVPLPEGVPPRRAVLAGIVETALNALWDAPVLVGDRVAVVGAGTVGCSVARLAARTPGARVTLVDVEPSRSLVADALGVCFASPEQARGGCDLVVHTSATSAGLQTALDLAADEATVVDLSWYGDDTTTVALGGAFHAGRLTLRSSQVGRVAPSRRASRTPRDRLGLALDLLRDPVFDALLTAGCSLEDLPDLFTRMVRGEGTALCQTVDYAAAHLEDALCTA